MGGTKRKARREAPPAPSKEADRPATARAASSPLLYTLLACSLLAFSLALAGPLLAKWERWKLCRPVSEVPLLGVRETLAHAAEAFPQYKPRWLSSDPPILVFDDFVEEAEADAILRQCESQFKRAQTGSGLQTAVRTSDFCFCSSESCAVDPDIGRVRRRASEVTGVPESHGEPLQVVRYSKAQEYGLHHDQQTPPDAPQGARIYTLLMYLTTPPGGGATSFPDINRSVAPVRGKAVLFPNAVGPPWVQAELLTLHAAEPVGGEGAPKLAANVWLHARPYDPALELCLGGYSVEDTVGAWKAARRAAGLDDTTPSSLLNASLRAARQRELAAIERGKVLSGEGGAGSRLFLVAGAGILVARVLGLV